MAKNMFSADFANTTLKLGNVFAMWPSHGSNFIVGILTLYIVGILTFVSKQTSMSSNLFTNGTISLNK